MPQRTVIGLTGGIGSGKTTVAKIFGDLGVHWVDADDVARQVVEPGTAALDAIAEHFGPSALTAEGTLNRAWLRQQVFNAPEQREWLERLLHPLIRESLVCQLKPGDGYALPYVILVSPLLLETDQHKMVHRILVVDAPEEVQIERTMARDQNTREQVENILAAQMSREERRSQAHAIIDTNTSFHDVERQVCELHNRFLVEFGQGV